MTDHEAGERSQPVRLTGNEAVLLDGEKGVRIVESGSVALFCVDVRDGEPAGPRRLLSRISSGQAVFSVPADAHGRLRFLIAPVHDAAIREISMDALWSDRLARGSPVHSMVEEWVASLARVVTGFPEPSVPVRVKGSREVALEDGQAMRADRNTVIWCRILEGRVRCMGSADMELDQDAGCFPLDSDMWVRASGPARVVTLATDRIEDARDVERGLSVLHGLVLAHLQREKTRVAEAERARLRQRDLIQDGRKADALSDLVAVLEPRAAPVTGDSPLLRALSAVGRSIGVDIRPPAESEALRGEGNRVEAIARASRIRARRVKLKGKWWRRDCGALLGYTGEARRPVGLIRTPSLRYEIYDPVDATRRPVTKDTAAQLSADAWMLYRPLPGGKVGLFDLFRFALAGRRREILLILVTGIVATLLGMITPQAMALLMDHAIPDADRRLLLEIGAGLLAAAFGQTVFRLSQGLVLLRLGLASEADSQAAVWDRLLHLRPSFFRRFSSGDLQSRVMAVSEISRQLSGVTLTSLFSSLLALLNLILLYYYSPSLTALALAVAVVAVGVTGTIGFFVRRNLRELVEQDGRLFGLVVQLLGGVGKLRVAGAAGRGYTHWLKKYGPTVKLRADTYRLEDHLHLFNQVLPTLSAALLFLFAYGLLAEGRQATVSAGLTLGIFLAFHTAFGTFLAGVTSLSNAAVQLLDAYARGRRIRPILEEEPETDETRGDPGVLTGRLAMNAVQFRYREDGPMALDGLDLRADPGEFVALVGPSGSGKSTTLRLLLGFESPSAGTVTYDGHDLASRDVLAVRRQIGVVLQGGRLDAGSILDNIACGDVMTLEQAWAAAEDAGFAEEIRLMPMGMHTMVSVGGGNLSGGQRQRLLIARALARRPRILLFDEATSALDNRTQAIVSESLGRLHVTRIVIAHRLSTIRDADRIYVLERGRIVQEGAFEQLMAARDGLFARMMRRQLA